MITQRYYYYLTNIIYRLCKWKITGKKLEIPLVVKIIILKLGLIKSHLPRETLALMLVTIHFVRNNEPVIRSIIGTSVGEGTFGKVKLGKHILTGEKVS
jgi:hypothetical protein